jgi:hypothetical protein
VPVFIDASALTHDVFVIPGDPTGATYTGTASAPLPAGDYAFQLVITAANFAFSVTSDGNITYDPAFGTTNGGFLEGQDNTSLTLVGYPVVLDATALDHDLEIGTTPPDFSHTATHDLVLLPGVYQTISSSGVVASFYFTLDATGYLSIEPDTVTVKGYAITFGGTLLTHDLYPQLLGVSPHLTPDDPQTLTIIPAPSHATVVDSRVVGDFRYAVGTDGSISYPASCEGFLEGKGTATLVFIGYPVVIDTTHASQPGAPDVSIVKPHVTRRYALQVLVPATWSVETSDGEFWILTLDQVGHLQFNPPQTKTYTAGSVPRLELDA